MKITEIKPEKVAECATTHVWAIDFNPVSKWKFWTWPRHIRELKRRLSGAVEIIDRQRQDLVQAQLLASIKRNVKH